jgi:hypothetical protein
VPVQEQRVSFLEGRVTELSQAIDRLQASLAGFEHRVDRRFEGVDRRLDALDAKVSRNFTWLVGLHITTLTAIVAALLAR